MAAPTGFPASRRQGAPASRRRASFIAAALGVLFAAAAAAQDPAPPPPKLTPSPPAATYEARVAPVFASYCSKCHGTERQKGGLRLDGRDGILKGGDHGPVIAQGDAAASEILRRLRLPPDNEHHMPPKDKAQPKAEDIGAIEAWIEARAPFEGPASVLGSGDPPGVPAPAPGSGNSGSRDRPGQTATALPPSIAPASPEALAALRARLVHVEPLAEDDPRLVIDFAAPAADIDDGAAMSLLTPVLEQIARLSLARTRITDAVLSLAARMPNLCRLDLRSTAVTGAGLAALKNHPAIEELILVRTKVKDEALDALLSMPALKFVHVWGSEISAGAVQRLRQDRPRLRIDAGDSEDAAALDVETEIKLKSDAPPPGAKPPAPISPLPVNAICPVSDKAVDPRYVIIHDSRAIGFCCPNCPAKFWAAPGSYADKLPRN